VGCCPAHVPLVPKHAFERIHDTIKNTTFTFYSTNSIIFVPTVGTGPLDTCTACLGGLVNLQRGVNQPSHFIQQIELHSLQLLGLGRWKVADLVSEACQVGDGDCGVYKEDIGPCWCGSWNWLFNCVCVCVCVCVCCTVETAL